MKIQVEADLIDYAINYYADGVLVLQEKWDQSARKADPQRA